MTKRKLTKHEVGLRYGFKSGLEERVAQQLNKLGVPFTYEMVKIKYKVNRRAKYTPDFVLENGIVIETKGRFMVQDRMKHLMIREQHPEVDIRFVFSNPKNKISKGSSTSYADWCDKHGFYYAQGDVPREWIDEAPDMRRIEALSEVSK